MRYFSPVSSLNDITKKILYQQATDTVKLTVGVAEKDAIVEIPITVIVSDENDNAPKFNQQIYDTSFEDGTIVKEFLVSDADLVGDVIEVTCADVSFSRGIHSFIPVN